MGNAQQQQLDETAALTLFCVSGVSRRNGKTTREVNDEAIRRRLNEGKFHDEGSARGIHHSKNEGRFNEEGDRRWEDARRSNQTKGSNEVVDPTTTKQSDEDGTKEDSTMKDRRGVYTTARTKAGSTKREIDDGRIHDGAIKQKEIDDERIHDEDGIQ